jgi:hypothetical protein
MDELDMLEFMFDVEAPYWFKIPDRDAQSVSDGCSMTPTMRAGRRCTTRTHDQRVRVFDSAAAEP